MNVPPRRALVTGATGFVGSAVARRLLAEGSLVRVLARPGSDRRNLADLSVEIAEGDLTDPASLVRACAGCDALFHVAADYRLWVPKPAEIYRANVDGTRAILDAARQAGVARVVYTSSVATLGIPKDGRPGDETTPVTLADMIGHYKRSKFLAEQVAHEFAAANDDVVIVNPSTPIGPRDVKPTPTGRVVRDAASGKMPAYVDTGLNLAHVDDVAEGHWLAYQKGRRGERYVLGGTDMSLREILIEIAGIVGGKPPKLRLPHAAVMPVAYAHRPSRGSPASHRSPPSRRFACRRNACSSPATRPAASWAMRRVRRGQHWKMQCAGLRTTVICAEVRVHSACRCRCPSRY